MARKKPPILVERYMSEKEFQKKSAKVLARGYEVQNVVTEEKGRGCLKWGLFGIFAFAFKPKHELVVTYRLITE